MAAIEALVMPKLGLAMTEGQVSIWHREVGATVVAGDEIADIETPKIAIAFESPASGTLRRHVVTAGQTVAVGALIGVLAAAATPEAEIDAFVAEWQARFSTETKAEATTAAGPEPELLETALGSIRILEAGAATAPPLLLVHGFGGDLQSYLLLQPLLASRFHTIALDLPGHGGSTKRLPGADPASLAHAITAVMDARAISSAHLVGHSLGGAVVLALTSEAPRRVSALTLISPAGLGEEINRAYVEGFLAARRARDMRAVLANLFADPALISREMIEELLRYKRLDGVDAALKAIVATCFPEGRQAFSFRSVLADTSRPARVIWGEEDRVLPPSQAEGLPAHVIVTRLAHAGHMAQMEKPAQVAQLI